MTILALIANTVRELSAKATLVVLLAISTLVIIGIGLAVSTHEVDGGVTLQMFGNPVTPAVAADKIAELIWAMQSGVAGGLFVGVVLFGVFATAGLIPDALEKGTVDLYLSKPVARWELLLGKYLGSVAVILICILYCIGAIWLVFGFRTGIWNLNFLFAAFTTTFVFACLFSIVVFLGVLFQNMAIPIIGAYLYLLVVGGILENRQQGIYLLSENSVFRAVIDGFYYLLPQLSAMQQNVVKQILHQPMDWVPFAQSFASSALLFAGAVTLLRKKDF